MGKSSGFIEYEQKNYSYTKVDSRIRNYREFIKLQDTEEIQRQGARCMDCGIPTCHSVGCPVYNLIPEWNDLVYKGKWREAYERLDMTNNLPEVTGRVCPAPCEPACTLSINSAPVTIKQIELAIIEKAYSEGWVLPRPPAFETGKRVAVVGSGPSGIAAAQQLRRMGHGVVLFEKAEKIGGLLRYGIPDYKLDKSVLDRKMEQMKAEGVTFETDVIIGEDLSARYLRKSFDVVLLTMGAGTPRDLPIPGRGLGGIHMALEYLSLSNKFVSGALKKNDIIFAKGKNVLVIGGGDTGSDCIGTAIRQGAKNIYQYEIMPKPTEWHEPWNPNWPQWPAILRTSSSHEEGCERDWNISTDEFRGSGRVEQALCSRVNWEKDKTGKFQMHKVKGSDFTLDVDLVFLAMGFVHVEHSRLLEDLAVGIDSRGNISADSRYATSVPGVFTAGDACTGASLVVRAINHGRGAAEAIDNYLK